MNRCVAPDCDRPIPVGQFCRRCLSQLDSGLRHDVQFAMGAKRSAAVEQAKACLGGPKARVERLLRAAYEADAAFSEELARVYGKRAAEMRYRFELLADRKLLDSLGDKLQADDALLAEMRRSA